jgi:uncharacterized protein involved in tolerance to divalent cations
MGTALIKKYKKNQPVMDGKFFKLHSIQLPGIIFISVDKNSSYSLNPPLH